MPDNPHDLSRRDMIRNSLAMAGLPAACCSTEELPAAAFSFRGTSLLVDLKKAPELGKPGSAVKVIDHERKVNLILVHGQRNEFVALQRSCTHGGAQVAFNKRNGTVQCTSWGHSEFALDGSVLGGSAKKPLPAYPVQRTGDVLEILIEATKS